MHSEICVDVAAAPHKVYGFAQDVARWPELLPHYRYVCVLKETAGERIVQMAARRDWIPIRWTAVERLDSKTPKIEFTHLSGWTVGMEVAWLFERMEGGTRVTITHDLDFRRVPLVGEWFGRRVIGDFFIQSIAARTLARIKQVAEESCG